VTILYLTRIGRYSECVVDSLANEKFEKTGSIVDLKNFGYIGPETHRRELRGSYC